MDELESLLKSHASELNRLYTSLGLPSSVTNEKLAELHQALKGTIERQRQDAHAEVASIKQDLDDVKIELRSLAGVLGCKLASDPATESLVEILKSRRRALATLLELKAERLGQFQTLFSHFSAILAVLGKEFVSDDIDISPQAEERNLTLVRKKTLEDELARCQVELDARTEALAEHITELAQLYDELCIEAHADAMLFFVDQGQPPPPPTKANLALISALLDNIEEERRHREAQIQTIYDALFCLWAKLGVPEQFQEEFVETYAGISDACIEAYQTELHRMEEVKNQNLRLWIAREREELRRLKIDLFLLPSDAVDSQDVDDEDLEDGDAVLGEIEAEKAELMVQAESKKDILLMISRYLTLLGDIKQLAASASDPNRLTGKGQRGDPGRLLREEKLRKRIAKDRPKLESDLAKLIPQWEEEYNEPFMIHGTRFFDQLRESSLASSGHQRSRSKTPGLNSSQTSSAPTLVPQHTGMSSASYVSTSTTNSHKRQQSNSRIASPAKRQREIAPGAVFHNSTNILTQAGNLKASHLPKVAQVGIGKASSQKSKRASFKPRLSSLSSLGPPKLYGLRTVSTTSSLLAITDDEG